MGKHGELANSKPSAFKREKEAARELSTIHFILNSQKKNKTERNKQTHFKNTEKTSKANNSQKGSVSNQLSHFLQ